MDAKNDLVFNEGELALLTQHPALSGANGTNRGTGARQIAADTDIAAVNLWLSQFFDKQSTFQSYFKEVSRFYLWVIRMRGKPLSSLFYEDWVAYLDFVKNPQPAADWIALKRVARGKPGYRPFSGPLSSASVRYTQTVIWSLFEWLTRVGYLSGNPLLTKRKDPTPKRQLTRLIDEGVHQEILRYIENLPKTTAIEIKHYAQTRWVYFLLSETAMRSSEAVNARKSHLLQLWDILGQRQLSFLSVIGKGDKERRIPVSPQLLEEMQFYWNQLGLDNANAIPDLPLVLSLQTKSALRPLSRQALFQQIKALFKEVAEQLPLEKQGMSEKLQKASTHWLRHTGATRMLKNGASIVTVQHVLGHAGLGTVGIYVHTEDIEAYKQLVKPMPDSL